MQRLAVTFCLNFWLLCQILYGQTAEEPLKINSGEVSYDGQSMTLMGQVAIEHRLGQITAHHLTIQPTKDKKLKFGLLEMYEDVQLQLSGGGELNCQKAVLDCVSLQGRCWGNNEQGQVIYRLPSVLVMTSDQMQINWLREAENGSKLKVQSIEASDHVHVDYQNDYQLSAQRVLYKHIPQTWLTLFAGSNFPCELLYKNDSVQAQQVEVDVKKEQLSLTEPTGQLKHADAHTLSFAAREMTWDGLQQFLHLKGEVAIKQNEEVHLFTKHEVLLKQTLSEGKKTLASIYSPKDTTFTYVKSGQTCELSCQGPLTLDHEHSRLTMQMDAYSTQQVYLKDALGEIYANQIVIDYQWQKQQMIPQKIILEGEVKLLNRFDGHIQESGGSILHYALADYIEYQPEKQELVLSSPTGNRVLFYDKINNVQMSAPSLKITRESATQKQIIQGVGDVRFTFIEKEMEQLKKYFEMDQEAKKD